jgi:hypothetical protein
MQLASFLTFTCICLVFIHRVRTQEPETWAMDGAKKWHQDWRTLVGAMTLSFVGILVRAKGLYLLSHIDTPSRFGLFIVLPSYLKVTMGTWRPQNVSSTA